MIKNIVFDIGKVLNSFDWNPYIKDLLGDAEAIAAVERAIWKSGLWLEKDRGVIDEHEMLDKMLELEPGYEQELRLAMDNIQGCLGRKPYAIPWIGELKEAGYNVYYLSNMSKHVIKAAWEAFDFVPHMDGGIFSCDVLLVKPEPEIYEALTEKYDLEPAECVFIDDHQENVDAAAALGWHGLLFTSYIETHRKLAELLESTR